MNEPPQIGMLALRGVAWSAAQNWGGRIFTFVLFVVLARLLSPAEFGLAAAAAIIVTLLGLVAEFGFGDAIVQRRHYDPADANLPFFASVAAAIVLAVVCFTFAETIEGLLDAPGLAPVVMALCAVAPLSTISLFQEIQYRRHFEFRKLAFRVFVANFIAGMVAIACAVAGLGVWSLIAQTFIAAAVGLVWLWHKPLWHPSFDLRPAAFVELARFGLPVVTQRVVDFGAARFFEVMLLGRYGLAIYGLYAAGSRLYLTLMQLLQTALNDVSLTILSRIGHDRDRMAQIYERTITMSALLFAPIFVVCAAVIPEISAVLFGANWEGVEDVARPLLLLGAVQAVQFLNGPYLSARGRPGTVLAISSLKNIAIVLGVLFLPSSDLVRFVQIFVLVQLVGTPVSFAVTMHELGVPTVRFLRNLAPATIGCIGAYLAVDWARPLFVFYLPGDFVNGLALGMVFGLCYVLLILAFGFRQVKAAVGFVKNRFRPE